MGVDGIDPQQVVGTYVEPEDWNELIDRDDVLMNRYFSYRPSTLHHRQYADIEKAIIYAGSLAAHSPKIDKAKQSQTD